MEEYKTETHLEIVEPKYHAILGEGHDNSSVLLIVVAANFITALAILIRILL